MIFIDIADILAAIWVFYMQGKDPLRPAQIGVDGGLAILGDVFASSRQQFFIGIGSIGVLQRNAQPAGCLHIHSIRSIGKSKVGNFIELQI